MSDSTSDIWDGIAMSTSAIGMECEDGSVFSLKHLGVHWDDGDKVYIRRAIMAERPLRSSRLGR